MEAKEQKRREIVEADPKCAICFEQPMVKPLVLEKCHHAFCFRCLKGWNNVHQTQNIVTPATMTRPLCRQENPNLADMLSNDISLLLMSAQEKNVPESFVREHCAKAMDKMGLMIELMQNGEGSEDSRTIPPSVLA